MPGFWARALAGLAMSLAVGLAGCADQPVPAEPALWHVTGTRGEEAWLFGTIHAAPRPIRWKTGKVAAALDRADEVMVEVANIADEAAVAAAFNALSRSPGLPPVAARIAPGQRPALRALMDERGLADGDLRAFETWAIALTLARPAAGDDSRNGIDRAVLAAAHAIAPRKRVIELEGAAQQLAIFDALPEREQRGLLGAVLSDAGALDDEADLVDTWRKGDMARIAAETRSGLLADPELRTALFTNRNRRWTQRIVAEMRRSGRPFVAVGAAHMAGPDGLVAMLEQAGYTVSRAQ